MAILKMKKLRICGVSEEQTQLIRQLQLLGSVEIGAPCALTDTQGVQVFCAGDGKSADALLRTSARLTSALETLKHYETKKGGLFAARPEKTIGELFSDEAYAAALDTAQAVLDAQDARSRLAAEKSRLTAVRESFVPWQQLPLPLETLGTQHTRILLGTVPAQTDLEALRARVFEAADEVQLEQISADQQSLYLLVFVHKCAAEAVGAALREAGFALTTFDGVQGTAAENIRRTDEAIAACEQQDAEKLAELTALAEQKSALQLAFDRCTQEISKAQAADRLVHSEKTFCLGGWVPCEDVGKLEALLSGFCCAWELTDPAPEEYPDVPVKLKNNKLTWPLNMVTEMYSLPAYDGVDPNPLMAPFFILFYGIMMADMGYGLLMILASIIITKKSRPKGTSGQMFGLMFSCGISTFLMGALTGGFFGDFLPQLVGIIDPDTTFKALPSLFTPLDDTITILIGAMALGFVQIVTGMAISFVEKIKKGQIMDAIWEELTWWIVFAGIACMALGVTNIVLYVGLAMVVVGSGWSAKGFGKVTAIFGSVYNHVTGYFGDILSYSRLMTLMLAGSVIASVFNTLGAIPGNVVFFLIVSALGNGLNFALNLLSCYVHDLRLQCLEYFGKFYQDGGKPFEPLAINTKYVDIQS
ncbi:MAG: V-type ATP synthase subunit I [Oscillospiraceae bacterium]|nr:V-type ATP synthase subunit I [Clostridiales bacterium]MCI6808345.1 V-type ATP synthase subunit I [Clostridiales bacterium]MCI7134854.1 V-type ATP synthase subunit I [Clostridiales bacterium]MDY4994347.1 V-type ATP synthase subunit I [Oscillospiraceae bacterium]